MAKKMTREDAIWYLEVLIGDNAENHRKPTGDHVTVTLHREDVRDVIEALRPAPRLPLEQYMLECGSPLTAEEGRALNANIEELYSKTGLKLEMFSLNGNAG